MESLECDLLRHIGTLSRCIHSIMDEKFKAYGFQRGQFIADRPDAAVRRRQGDDDQGR